MLGVYLFFVLSGLLMSRLLFVKQVDLPTFFARRISRVVPTFWVFVVAMVFYAMFFEKIAYRVPLSEAFLTLIFLRTYLPIGADIWADQWPIGHVWSLNVEEHSYIFLALVACLCRKSTRSVTTVLLLFSSSAVVLAINMFFISHPIVSGSPWYLRSEAASLALLTAAALYVGSPWMPILTFTIAVASCSTYAHRGLDRTVAPICLAYTVVYLDQVPDFVKKCLSIPMLRWFGARSFSLYLWQQPFYLAVTESKSDALLMGALAIATGAASFYTVENPMRLWMNSAWSRYLGKRDEARAGQTVGEKSPI